MTLKRFVSHRIDKIIFFLFLFTLLGISGCSHTKKNVTPRLFLPLEASEYIPEDLALEYLSHFFDVNEHGILLEKPNMLTLNLTKKRQRFSFKKTNLYMRVDVDDAGNVIWANGVWLFVTTKYFPELGDSFLDTFMTKVTCDWHALFYIRDFQRQDAGRTEQKTRKICTALDSLGVNVK